MTVVQLKVLKAAYADAVRCDEPDTTIAGMHFDIQYLKYVLEYAELRRIKDDEYINFTRLPPRED